MCGYTNTGTNNLYLEALGQLTIRARGSNLWTNEITELFNVDKLYVTRLANGPTFAWFPHFNP